MQVTSATYTSDEKTSVEVHYDNGDVRCFPEPLPGNIKVDLGVSTYSSWRESHTPANYEVDLVAQAMGRLAASDEKMARVTEDLIALLDQNGVIDKDDLPAQAKAHISDREQWRQVISSSSSSSSSTV